MTLKCPACGSGDLLSQDIAESFSAPLGPPVLCRLQKVTCKTCDESGDFFDVNDERISAALDESTQRSIEEILRYLSEAGLSNAYVERVFGIPARTINRWKKEKQKSAAAVALLRVLRTFPWIAKVADERFEPVVADMSVVFAAGDALRRLTARASIVNSSAYSGGVAPISKLNQSTASGAAHNLQVAEFTG